MPSPANAVEPCAVPSGEPATPDTTVLDRVAARVRQRLAAERSEASRSGGGTHAASLVPPLPL